jgi:hypothetical protein
MANPAASSAPELIREPEDNCCNVLFRLVSVVDNWFSAVKDAMLFRILNAIVFTCS